MRLTEWNETVQVRHTNGHRRDRIGAPLADRAREAALRESLYVMRDAIDKYHADTGVYPDSLEDLVDKRYLRKLPPDPLTDSTETWQPVSPPAGQPGRVYDIHSGAPGEDRDGRPYAEW